MSKLRTVEFVESRLRIFDLKFESTTQELILAMLQGIPFKKSSKYAVLLQFAFSYNVAMSMPTQPSS